MAQTASDQHELILMELLRGFMEFASTCGQKSFPPFEHKLWHDFLFLLKSEHQKQFPQLACIGDFDWVGEYPKCRDYDAKMFRLRYTCYSKIPGGRVFLIKKITTEITPLLLYYPEIAQRAVEIASTFPGFFESRKS